MTRKSTALFAALVASLAIATPAAAAAPSRAELARKILDDGGITLLNSHVGGQNDPESTARQNIRDTAAGKAARTSPWSDVGVTEVQLSADLLKGMVAIGADYDYRVTTIAGGDHSSTSYHYAGTAFDVDQIDGRAVSASNPKVAKIKSACESAGAVEILGPGDAGHDSHVHCAWRS
ncbi:carboxypeptidase [Saccharopolyspora taberi]|uniref:Carboxypeptidase n=1 Tax=Saccharopolyspora taberi TaxID=60895 RepID=A0ABN3V8N2_9PSEU